MSGAATFRPGEQTAQVVVIFKDAARAARDAGHGVIGEPRTDIDFFPQALAQAPQLTAAAGNRDAAFHQVGDQFRRRIIQRVLHRVDDDAD